MLESLAMHNPGDVVELSELFIRLDYAEEHTWKESGFYYLLHPRDLDIKETDSEPYSGDFPYLHLNLPLLPENSPTACSILSDQPESIKDDNEYLEDTGSGTDGLYGKATAPGGKRIRFLADHYNQSTKTKWLKVYMTSAEDTMAYIHKKGSSVAENSIVAGSIADQISHQVNLSDMRTITAGTPALLGEWGPIHPEDTAVVLYEMTPARDVTIWSVITDEDALTSPSIEDLERLPKLKSCRWREREEKLRSYVNPQRFPSRYARVLDCFIHARGLFQFPDRFCRSSYDYAKNPYWIQAYSPFEHIEGIDELTADGTAVETENRGNYGGYIRMNIKLRSLPEGTGKVAVVALNTADSLGGMFKTTINRTTGTFFVFNKMSLSNEIITQRKAAILWKGDVKPGDALDIQFFSLANTSVRLWYLVIPIP